MAKLKILAYIAYGVAEFAIKFYNAAISPLVDRVREIEKSPWPWER